MFIDYNLLYMSSNNHPIVIKNKGIGEDFGFYYIFII